MLHSIQEQVPYLIVDQVDKLEIANCYDSHTHFLATGQVASGLNLTEHKSIHELEKIKFLSNHFRDDWIVGFGWDQHLLFTDGRWPTAMDLDRFFPDRPCYFSRVDGHTGWCNSIGIKKLSERGFKFNDKKYPKQISRNSFGEPTGLFYDQAHIDALIILPDFSQEQKKSFLVKAAQVFNQGGFTHVRDLSSNLETWHLLHELFEKNKINICVEGNVTIENVKGLEWGIEEINKMKKINSPFLRVQGLKLFIDGSLGSETAALSKNYIGKNFNGNLFWESSDIKKAIEICWMNNLQVSFHVIGDLASDLVVNSAREVSASGLMGRINLEHCQILTPSTIQKMKPLHVTCHFQPCHWLSDKSWLKEKIHSDNYKNIFQWNLLEKNKIKIQFGSDSPIEKASLIHNLRAISDSTEKEIMPPISLFQNLHSHPDKKWTHSRTIIDSEKVIEVYFDSKKII